MPYLEAIKGSLVIEHVRVGENPHETSLNASSSVQRLADDVAAAEAGIPTKLVEQRFKLAIKTDCNHISFCAHIRSTLTEKESGIPRAAATRRNDNTTFRL